jgi:hypothetical protein
MTGIRNVPRLAKLIRLARAICDAIEVARDPIRQFVPADRRVDYDQALDQIVAGCAVIRSIAYNDGRVSVELPWGE